MSANEITLGPDIDADRRDWRWAIGAYNGAPLDRPHVVEFLQKYCSSATVAEHLIAGPFDQLQDVLAGLVQNSMPRDDEIVYKLYSNQPDSLQVLASLRPGNFFSRALVSLHLQVRDNQITRATSIEARREFIPPR